MDDLQVALLAAASSVDPRGYYYAGRYDALLHREAIESRAERLYEFLEKQRNQKVVNLGVG